MSPDAVATAIAALLASVTGVFAAIANRRSRRAEEHSRHVEEGLHATNETAALQAAEVDGWRTLIDTLMAQYTVASNEAAELRTRLHLGNQKFEEIREQYWHAQGQIATLTMRVEVLRTEVTRLGGDVDKINGVGKQGPDGEKGPVGDKGAKGDKGDSGPGALIG